METNQLAPQTPPPRESTEYLPIRVAYVHAVGADLHDPFIPEMRGFCHEHRVQFTTREYMPRKYSEDRDFIERLPALQLDEGRYNHKTFYPNTRPYQIVEEAVMRYKTRELNKESSKGAWKKTLVKLQETVASLFHKKTRMEEVEEERKARRTTPDIPVGKIVYEPAAKKKPQGKPKMFGSIN
jgi:hypothetical protein